MMIQQMLPPQKPLLLHIETTSEKFFAAVCRSFQDIPQAEFGAKKAGTFKVPAFCNTISPTDHRGIFLRRSVPSGRQ